MAVLLSFALVGFSSNSEAQEAEMLAGFQQHCDNSDSACVIENDTVPFWLVGAVASCLPLLISPRSVLNAVISRWLPAAFPYHPVAVLPFGVPAFLLVFLTPPWLYCLFLERTLLVDGFYHEEPQT